MPLPAWVERVGNLAHGMKRRREDDARTRWSRDRLEAFQRERLSRLVAWASERSPFYRELYGGPVRGPVELSSLPVVTKNAMMGAFDRFVTAPELRLADLERSIEHLHGDELFAGRYRIMTSSGSSGRKAIYVYDRDAWRDGIVPALLRSSRMMGLAPRLPRPRVLGVSAPDGKHMTFRGSLSLDVGAFAALRVPASTPLPELCARAEAHQPEYLFGYPSVVAMLAEEQRAGRLRIAPRVVVTSSEVCTPAMKDAIREAWGVRPFDMLGLTETGITAMDCAHHTGLHVFEDLALLEVVDDEGRAVPPGTHGAKVLVTNLYNLVQPIIRFEVSDLIAIDDAPCPCGMTLRRIVALDGRSDDVLELPGPAGPVRIHPIHLRSALASDRRVLQYQIVQQANALDVQVVLAGDAGAADEIAVQLSKQLRERGAEVRVRVRAVAEIPREAGAGKLKLVKRLA